MKPAERDNLLIRLDERTQNIWNLTEKQEAHLSKINDAIAEHTTSIAVNKNSIRLQWKIFGGTFTIISAAIALVLKLLGVY